MPEDEVRAVAENLLEALRFFGQARADAEIRDLPGVSLIFCGLNYAAFNAALQARPIHGDAQELARLIDVSAEHFDARSLRWTYWVCEDFLDQPLRREALRVFKRHGMRHLTEAPGMYAERLMPATRSLPLIDVRPVADESTRNAFSEVMSTAFEIPHSVSMSVYGAERAWKGTFQGYVGYSNGRAVNHDGGRHHRRHHRALFSGDAAAASTAGVRRSHHAPGDPGSAADARRFAHRAAVNVIGIVLI
jgi:hypothetical protein